ncbi:MAG: protein-tyrosine phosphatase family protein [Planctomycetota bacterium]|jgi:hypothetical protein
MNGTSLQKQRAVSTAGILGCLLVAMCGRSGTFAGEASSVAGDLEMLQPFIGETTIVVLKVDPTRISLPDLPDALKSAVPGSAEVYGAWRREAAKGIESFRAAAGGQAVYVTVGIARSPTDCAAFLFLKETPDVNRKQLSDFLGALNPMESSARYGLLVAVPKRNFDVAAAIDALVPTPRKGLADAFEAVGNYPIQVLLLPPDHVRRTVTELMPQLPRHLGGGPSDVLTEGLIWAALGVDPGRFRAELVVQSASEEAARSLAEYLPEMLESICDELPDTKTQMQRKMPKALLSLARSKVDGDRLTVRLAGPE